MEAMTAPSKTCNKHPKTLTLGILWRKNASVFHCLLFSYTDLEFFNDNQYWHFRKPQISVIATCELSSCLRRVLARQGMRQATQSRRQRQVLPSTSHSGTSNQPGQDDTSLFLWQIPYNPKSAVGLVEKYCLNGIFG